MIQEIYYGIGAVVTIFTIFWWLINSMLNTKRDVSQLQKDVERHDIKMDKIDEKYNDIKLELSAIKQNQQHMSTQLTDILVKQDKRIEKIEDVIIQLKDSSAKHDNCILRTNQSDILKLIKD